MLRNSQLRTKRVWKYTLYFSRLTDSARASQIWPHLAALVLTSLLRYAAPAVQTNPPGDALTATREPDLLPAEMKEYDA
jgi:hypothetical protein